MFLRGALQKDVTNSNFEFFENACYVQSGNMPVNLFFPLFRYVVDSGFVKQLSYNPRTGLDALQVVPISR